MVPEKIKNLEDVLKLEPHQKVIDYKLDPLTKPGDNYGSLMLRLEVRILNEKSKAEETLNLVAKLLPPNEFMQKIFNVQVTSKNEAALYSIIAPLLEEFQKEQGVSEVLDVFAKFYGARISLNPDDNKVDEDAVLILENLKIKGFTLEERMKGFDYDSAELIVTNLAYFHAVGIAFKLKKPEVFRKEIMPHLADFYFAAEGTSEFVDRTMNTLKENEKCTPYLGSARELLVQRSLKVAREPFATISHNDYWTNNIMLKFENGKPVANKMLDFQVIEYKSPCRDLLFFLFSSVELKVLEGNVQKFINLYYEKFIQKLHQLQCDTTDFSRDTFDKELELAAKEAEYFHIAIMIGPIFADENSVKDIGEFKPEDLKGDWHSNFTHIQAERLHFLTLEFAKNGWLV